MGRDDDRRELNPSASAKYRAQLDRLFTTGKAEGAVKTLMDRRGAGGDPAEEGSRAARIHACHLAEDQKSFNAALDEVLTDGDLPDDVELLLRVVDHPKEAVVTEALERIERLIRRQPLKRKASFLQRLYTLEQVAVSPDLREVVNRLIEDLA